MKTSLEVLDAATAHSIALDKHQIKVFKQIKKAMRDIHFCAKHGHFSIRYINMDTDVSKYLKALGYSIETFVDMDDDLITIVKWNKGENYAEDT